MDWKRPKDQPRTVGSQPANPSEPWWRQRSKVLAAVVGIVIVGSVIAGLTDGAADGGDLLPAHRKVVDSLASQRDCDSLQNRFDDADANRGEPGGDRAKRNLALMKYADEAMQRIGCYGD